MWVAQSFMSENGVVTAIVAVFLVFVLAGVAVIRRYKVAGPDEAYIITGRRGKDIVDPTTGKAQADLSGQRIVMGAGVFVLPFLQRLHVMSLSSRRIPVGIQGAVSSQGVKTALEGVAIVKVGGNEDAIRAAAQRFLGQQQAIELFTQEVLAGSLRSIVGRLTVEEIIKDRAAFASAVAEEAETSLTNQGLSLDTFQLQDIQAEGTYIQDLGRPESARVAQDASIAEARAREAAERERLLAEENIAIAARQLELKQAEILAETDAAKAQAAAAGPLSAAEQDQRVIAEQEKVAERRALLTEKQLDTEVRKPADADRYKVEQNALAAKNSAIMQADAAKATTIAAAEAKSEQDRITGDGERSRRSALAEANEIEGRAEGAAQKARREAIAEAVAREGLAEAEAIRAKGDAEAEAMAKKADSFERYGQAAVLDLVIETLPELVRAASEPMAAIDKLTVISTDGASDVVKTVSTNVEQGISIASDLTGIDFQALFANLVRRNAGVGDDTGPIGSSLFERAPVDVETDADGGAGAAPSPPPADA